MIKFRLLLILLFASLAICSISAQSNQQIPQYLWELRAEVDSLQKIYNRGIEEGIWKIEKRRLEILLTRKKANLLKAETADQEVENHTGPSIRFLTEKHQELLAAKVGEDLVVSELVKFYGDRVYQFEGFAFNDGSWVGVYADEPNISAEESWGIYYYKAKMENDTLANKGFIYLLQKYAMDEGDYSFAKSKGNKKIDSKQSIHPDPKRVEALIKEGKDAKASREQAAREAFTDLWGAKQIKVEGVLAKEDWGGSEYLVLKDWIILKQ